ncbi:MB12A protein, partial [Bucco capensis]|nr:MB12A protein [Bucco capensis]
MAAAQGQAPLTGVGLVAAPEAAPEGWSVLTLTVEGTAANLGKGFGHKGGGYLCVRSAGDESCPAPVVTDVQVLSERSPQPSGYSRVPEFPEPRPGICRKKLLYVRMLPVESTETAVLELQLSSKSRAIPQYLRIGELGHFALWCKKGAVGKVNPPPVPKPRSIGLGLKQLTLQDTEEQHSSKPGAILLCPRSPLARGSSSKAGAEQEASYGLSAMDGIPFTLHPSFETKLSSSSNVLLMDLNIKSLADIEREYNYGFVVERTAAARLPPRL